jgi:hypothetical protein
MLIHIKPGETVLKAIKRLGNSSGGSTSVSLSASQRWSKKKQTSSTETVNSEKAKADKLALETLTGKIYFKSIKIRKSVSFVFI